VGYSNIKVALGMHPEIIEKKSGERELLMACIQKAQFIGEVGMDGSIQYQNTISLQESVFNDVLMECERVGGRVLSIHSRNAADRVLDLVEQHIRSSIPVLHWFSGTVKETQRAISLGCWFSIGPAMLFGAKGRRLLKLLPQDKVLPETDGPFTQKRNGPLMPWDSLTIVRTVASTWDTTEKEVCHRFKLNLSNLLKISGDGMKAV